MPLPAALKTKPKVVPPSGPAPTKLVVKDLIKGTGPAASATSTVTVNYVGVLYKGGKEFDSSWKRGTTAVVPAQRGHPRLAAGDPRDEGRGPARADRAGHASATRTRRSRGSRLTRRSFS